MICLNLVKNSPEVEKWHRVREQMKKAGRKFVGKRSDEERKKKYEYDKIWRAAHPGYHCAAQKRYNRKYPERQIASKMKRSYGISLEIYREMLVDQEERCAICRRHQSEFKRRLAVDHDHDTKKVRALLCDNCNVAVGHLQENPAFADQVAAYLRTHGKAA